MQPSDTPKEKKKKVDKYKFESFDPAAYRRKHPERYGKIENGKR